MKYKPSFEGNVDENLGKIGVIGRIHQKIHNSLKALIVVEADDEVQWKHLELMKSLPSPVHCLVFLVGATEGKHPLQDSDKTKLNTAKVVLVVTLSTTG